MNLDADVLVGLSRYSIMASKPAARFVAGIITSKVLSGVIPPPPPLFDFLFNSWYSCLGSCVHPESSSCAVDFSEYAAFP